MIIEYYFPVEGAKNKANNGNLTFDFFKKHFKLPLNPEYFISLNYSEELEFPTNLPQFKEIIAFSNGDLIWQGIVEGIIKEKRVDSDDCIRVLLNPIK